MPWKCQESCIRTQCFTKNVLDIVSTRLCFIHELWERVGMNSPHTNSHPQSPHFRFEKQIETGQTWCFCTKKKIDWAEATAKAYKWRLWNTGFWLAESIWSQPMALALRFAANPCEILWFICQLAFEFCAVTIQQFMQSVETGVIQSWANFPHRVTCSAD